MTVHADLVERAIDPMRLLETVASTAMGATALFVGTVREVNEGRRVEAIEYAVYPEMARRELRAIAQEAARRHGVALAIEHRVGTLALGDVSVAIAAAHAHRVPAFAATREVIEAIKQRVPIWKREHYSDGTREWVRASSGAAAEASR